MGISLAELLDDEVDGCILGEVIIWAVRSQEMVGTRSEMSQWLFSWAFIMSLSLGDEETVMMSSTCMEKVVVPVGIRWR